MTTASPREGRMFVLGKAFLHVIDNIRKSRIGSGDLETEAFSSHILLITIDEFARIPDGEMVNLSTT